MKTAIRTNGLPYRMGEPDQRTNYCFGKSVLSLYWRCIALRISDRELFDKRQFYER